MIGFGIYGLVARDSVMKLLPDFPLTNAVYVLIAVGGVIFLTGFLGCCGAVKESKCLLMMFFVIVLILFIVEITGVVLLYVYYPKIKPELVKIMTKDDEFSIIQKEGKCCGFDGAADYTSNNSPIPASCYPNEDKAGTAYKKGCKDLLFHNMWLIGGVGIFILFIELLAMISAIALYRGVENYETA